MRYVAPTEMERPNADLSTCAVCIDWQTVRIVPRDDAAAGRIFKWLTGQMQLAKEAAEMGLDEGDMPSRGLLR